MKIHTKYRDIKTDPLKGNVLFKKIATGEPVAVAQTIPIAWKKAIDFTVWDDKGNRFIDLTSGIFVTNAGHANPHIKKAIKKQLDSDMLFAYNYPTDIKQRLLKKLFSLSPKHFNRVALLNSGSEAMDLVYKFVKFYGNQHNKKYIIVIKGNYHGRGLSNDLISGNKERSAWSHITDPSVIFIDFPYNGDEKFDPSILPKHDQIAGFIVETFQGWGAWFYPKGFLNDLNRFAKKVGALLCFDEMQAGFYRLGPLYGYQTYGPEIKPDIIALGKGFSSAMPISAVLSRKDIVDADTKADLHGTHSASAIAAAAALANLEFLSNPKRLKQQKEIEKVFKVGLEPLAASPQVKQVNVRGMIAALIFHTTDEANKVVFECIRNGVLPVCTNRNSIKLAPPLTITADVLKEVFQVFRSALKIK